MYRKRWGLSGQDGRIYCHVARRGRAWKGLTDDSGKGGSWEVSRCCPGRGRGQAGSCASPGQGPLGVWEAAEPLVLGPIALPESFLRCADERTTVHQFAFKELMLCVTSQASKSK